MRLVEVRAKIIHVLLAAVIVTLVPYAIFGQSKRVGAVLAVINGVQISLAGIFFEPLWLLANPFLALLAAVSPVWKKKRHAIGK